MNVFVPFLPSHALCVSDSPDLVSCVFSKVNRVVGVVFRRGTMEIINAWYCTASVFLYFFLFNEHGPAFQTGG